MLLKHKSLKRKKATANMLVFFILLVSSITMIIPFYWMIMTSFDWDTVLKLPFPPRFLPLEPTLKTYQMAFMNVPMLKYMLNSIIICIFVILISSLSALASGYSLSKIRFKGYKLVLVFILSTMMIPFETTMVPQYMLFRKLNLLNTYWAFYLPAVSYVFGTFFVKQFMDSLPSSLREAAKIDGANELIIFFKIYVPLCKAAIATMIILLFLGQWNNLLWPMLVLDEPAKYTVQIGLAMFSYNKGMNQMPAVILAATTVSLVPILILYLFLQRYIVESVALSGLKQ